MSISTLPDSPTVVYITGRRTNPLINRDFTLLWGGQAVSILGDLIFTTTITLWVGIVLAHGQTWAALAVSGTLAAAAMPALLLAPLAGVLVDRFDKRRTMIAMDALRAAAVAALLSVPFLGARHWSPLVQLLVKNLPASKTSKSNPIHGNTTTTVENVR